MYKQLTLTQNSRANYYKISDGVTLTFGVQQMQGNIN